MDLIGLVAVLGTFGIPLFWIKGRHEERKRRVRRLFYNDFPEQKGKTPPTLGQWLDEIVEAQKKIGTPGYAFWREFPYEAFQRFSYIGEKRWNAS